MVENVRDFSNISGHNPKALLISLYFPPEINGGASGAWNRAVCLSIIGYSVYVLCGFPSYPTGRVSDPKYKGKLFLIENMDQFTLLRLRLPRMKHDGYFRRLLIFLNFVFLAILFSVKIHGILKADLIYARAPILFSSWIGWFYSKINKAPFLYEAPDLWPEELVVFKSFFSALILSCGKLMAKISYSIPDVVVTVSKSAASVIMSTYDPSRRVYALPVGVDPTKFLSLSGKISREHLIKLGLFSPELKEKFIILYSGLISSAQGVEDLVYLANMLKEDKKIAFVIVGQGPSSNALYNLKDSLRLDNLYLLSSQERSIMPKLISAVDACSVLLSSDPIFEIAIPTKFYEYLACRKPILGICKGELNDIIKAHKIGYCVSHEEVKSMASYIVYLKDHPDVIEVIRENCLKALQLYSLDKIAEGMAQIIKESYGQRVVK